MLGAVGRTDRDPSLFNLIGPQAALTNQAVCQQTTFQFFEYIFMMTLYEKAVSQCVYFCSFFFDKML